MIAPRPLFSTRMSPFVGCGHGPREGVSVVVLTNKFTSAGLRELNIPGIQAVNGSAKFTISFEPSKGRGGTLVERVNADQYDAQTYGGSKGHQDISAKDYAQLANNMYITGSIISNENNKYNFAPGSLPGGGYNSNSGLYTIANLNGQGAAYNQFQTSLWAARGLPLGNVSIPMGSNGIGPFNGGGYGSEGTAYTSFVAGNAHSACGTLCR
jgi:hypothetical protein